MYGGVKPINYSYRRSIYKKSEEKSENEIRKENAKPLYAESPKTTLLIKPENFLIKLITNFYCKWFYFVCQCMSKCMPVYTNCMPKYAKCMPMYDNNNFFN